MLSTRPVINFHFRIVNQYNTFNGTKSKTQEKKLPPNSICAHDFISLTCYVQQVFSATFFFLLLEWVFSTSQRIFTVKPHTLTYLSNRNHNVTPTYIFANRKNSKKCHRSWHEDRNVLGIVMASVKALKSIFSITLWASLDHFGFIPHSSFPC